MAYLYTTADGLAFAAEDGTLLALANTAGLITNRTVVDVARVLELETLFKNGMATDEQKREYLDVNHKGAYNYRDMNRVEEAVNFVATELRDYGYLDTIPEQREWSVESIPTASDWDSYFGNVAAIRNAVTVWEDTPDAPRSVIGFDVDKANALEQILVDVDDVLAHIKAAWFFSGDLYSGEV